jgi:hypothetical protein
MGSTRPSHHVEVTTLREVGCLKSGVLWPCTSRDPDRVYCAGRPLYMAPKRPVSSGGVGIACKPGHCTVFLASIPYNWMTKLTHITIAYLGKSLDLWCGKFSVSNPVWPRVCQTWEFRPVVFWSVTSYNLVDRYQHFRRIWYSILTVEPLLAWR